MEGRSKLLESLISSSL